jgi:hypothetical protein
MAGPKSFKTRFIEPGIVSYDDQEAGTVLVSKEALDLMAPTFRGCPVIFVPEHHNDTDKETAFDFGDVEAEKAQGVVSGMPYWGDDGWQWVDLLVWDQDAIKAIEKGFSVSCAYIVDETGEGGEWHQIPYDESVTNGHYMHMAIVPRPRYEGSQILANSKGGHKVALFKPKKNAMPVEPEKKPVEEKDEGMLMNDDTSVDVNGTPVPLYELIEAYKMKMGAGNTPSQLTPEDTVEVEGFGSVKVADLIAAYGPGGEGAGEEEPLENAEPPQDVTGEKPVDEKKQMSNAAPAKPEPRKVNPALKNAAKKTEGGFDPRGEVDSETKRLERGRTRYTLPVKNGGK